MLKKTKVPARRVKKASKKAETAGTCSYTEINVCEPDDKQVHAKKCDYYIWLNSNAGDCDIDFDVDGCPLDECQFKVPGGSPAQPGRYPTKVTGKSGTYSYNSPCCPPILTRGQPKIIID
jgi:hypothetical protein